LAAHGRNPRCAIGLVNLTGFFVALAQSINFVLSLTLRMESATIILGLLLGDVLAAPPAAFAARHISPRLLLKTVAVLIIILSVRTLILTLG
jgi:hypothetical protein